MDNDVEMMAEEVGKVLAGATTLEDAVVTLGLALGEVIDGAPADERDALLETFERYVEELR